MKRFAQFFFGLRPILLYTLALYTLAIISNVFIVHGQELSCKEYLHICETSCVLRGELVQFACLGTGINPGSDRYRCLCGDEAFRITSRRTTAIEAEPVYFEKRDSLGTSKNEPQVSDTPITTPESAPVRTSYKVQGTSIQRPGVTGK